MSNGDFVSQDSSADEGFNVERLVPVAESIRYRKRAQAAEKNLEDLDGELQKSNELNKNLSEELEQLRLEKKLSGGLISAGVCDLETGLLVAKQRLAESEDKEDVESVIEKLRKEKGHLFSRQEGQAGSVRTKPVRERGSGTRTVLEKAARDAAGSGSRRDVQEYMRLRRQFV